MDITNLQKQYLFSYLSNSSSFVFKLMQLGHVWIFNCFEGSQHILTNKKIKVSQIKKIIITNNHIRNLGGLLGLLSTLSLNTNIRRIDIYGPVGLEKYILLGRKYSYTNFRYKMYFHIISIGSFNQNSNFNISSYMNYDYLNYCFIFFGRSASFNIKYAVNFNIPFGPLFGYLKSGKNFILPDGFIVYSNSFISGYYLGSKIVLINNNINKHTIKIIKNSTYLLHD